MKIAAAYIRVSTGDQLEYSPDSQLKAIREYARRNELVLCDAHIYVDEGISGRTAENRPSFMRMIAAAKSPEHPFDVILLWKFSRFARNREDSIVYKSMLRRQCGVEVVSVSEQLGEDKTSILIEALLEAMDEYYSVNLGQEVTRGMAEKAERGGVVSTPPFGYFVRENVFVPDEAASPAVEMAFRDFAGGMPLSQVAQKLNMLGFTSKRGNPWQSRTVRYMLSNPVYMGLLRWTPGSTGKEIRSRGSHPPIIGEALFLSVQERLRRTKAGRRPCSRAEEPASFMLKGLVTCSDCHRTLVMSARGESLQCSGYAKGKCGRSHFISLPRLEKAVLDCIRGDFPGMTLALNIQSAANALPLPETQLLAQERKKLERIMRAYESGADTLEEYRVKKAASCDRRLQLEQLCLNANKAALNPAVYPRSLNLCAFLDDPQRGVSEKNHLLRAFVRQIIYDKEHERVALVYYF